MDTNGQDGRVKRKIFEPHKSLESMKPGESFQQSPLVKTAGRIVGEPEVLEINSTNTVVLFRLDILKPSANDKGMPQSHGESFPVIALGRDVERLREGMKAGNLVYIEGRYRAYSWGNDQGDRFRAIQFEATKIQPLTKGRDKSPEQERDL